MSTGRVQRAEPGVSRIWLRRSVAAWTAQRCHPYRIKTPPATRQNWILRISPLPPAVMTSRLPDQQPDGGRIVRVARIVELGTIRNEAQDVHLRPQFDVTAARTDAVRERQPALFRHRHVHEEIDVMRDVTFG